MAKVLIGTSGWVYKHWSFDYAQDKQNYFYPQGRPEKEWLSFYSSHFATVEVNSSFYHQVLPKTYNNWAISVPESFIFSLKASRFITHIKRLKDPKDPVKNFLGNAGSLKKKMGPVLFQLPPQMREDKERLETFLSTVYSLLTTEKKEAIDSSQWSVVRLAFEFRHPSWFVPEIYTILKKYNASLVIADSSAWPCVEEVTADFVYLRFHGKELYSSNYPLRELEKWAEKIKKWQREGLDVYGYFNNDAFGYAPKNAETLISLLS